MYFRSPDTIQLSLSVVFYEYIKNRDIYAEHFLCAMHGTMDVHRISYNLI